MPRWYTCSSDLIFEQEYSRTNKWVYKSQLLMRTLRQWSELLAQSVFGHILKVEWIIHCVLPILLGFVVRQTELTKTCARRDSQGLVVLSLIVHTGDKIRNDVDGRIENCVLLSLTLGMLWKKSIYSCNKLLLFKSGRVQWRFNKNSCSLPILFDDDSLLSIRSGRRNFFRSNLSEPAAWEALFRFAKYTFRWLTEVFWCVRPN